MPWTSPYRPRSDGRVTQGFEDGIVTICTVENAAEPGYQSNSLPPKSSSGTRSGGLASSAITRGGKIKPKSSGCSGYPRRQTSAVRTLR